MKRKPKKSNGALWLDDEALAAMRMQAIEVAARLPEPQTPAHGMSGFPGKPRQERSQGHLGRGSDRRLRYQALIAAVGSRVIEDPIYVTYLYLRLLWLRWRTSRLKAELERLKT